MRVSRIAVFACLLAAGAAAYAEGYTQFPGPSIDSSTLRFKQKVEEIYASGNHQRALLIYEKELAPLGDKYAQYMTGYMHLTGRGVEADRAAAMAWYRLAAERGEPKFIEARDALAERLSPAERRRARELFAALWQRHGDRRIILELMEEDIEILRDAEVDTFGAAEGSAAIASGYSGNRPVNPYHGRVRAQLAERLHYLDSMPDHPPGVDDSRIDALEAGLRRELEALDLP